LSALHAAVVDAGGLDDVAAVSVAAQQHGMVTLDDRGQPVRPALLWNDVRSAPQSEALIEALGGQSAWVDAVNIVPVPSFTITKLRWLAEQEPAAAARVAAVCLPHDWLTWKLLGKEGLDGLTTDRSDASGTGYWSSRDDYRDDLIELAFGRRPLLPRVLAGHESPGVTKDGIVLGAGAGDNAAAAFGLGAQTGDVIVSVGTSGVACAVSDHPAADPSGAVAGFADAAGGFLPLVCTLNGALVLDSTARMLGVDLRVLGEMALAAPPGAAGLVLVPYLDGERTPNLPTASGALHGLTNSTATPQLVARAAFEGVMCGIADAVDALVRQQVAFSRVILIGGAARSPALQQVAATVFGVPIAVPRSAEHVANGAARQAAWAIEPTSGLPQWERASDAKIEADPAPGIRARYADACEHTVARLAEP
jgi:xylulokinase